MEHESWKNILSPERYHVGPEYSVHQNTQGHFPGPSNKTICSCGWSFSEAIQKIVTLSVIEFQIKGSD